ncbi:MAG TPA: sugar ABC transporter substrate-binding protein [Chloroflexota bacterium]|nr:sugar ABC transporter substrate-binding protein [Chloroflexota bacterium]
MVRSRTRFVTRRPVVLGALALPAALGLAACGASDAPGGQKSAAPARISVITRGGGDGTGMEQVIIPAFTKVHENIKVEHASLGGEPDYWAKVVTGHMGKELGDVVWASNGGFSALASRGVMKELEPLARSDKYKFDDYVQAGLDSLKHDGKLYGLPWGGHPGYAGLVYNEELLSRAGFRPPDATWTWDRVAEVARATARVTGDPNSDVYGFRPYNPDYLGQIQIVRGNGGDWLDKEGKKFVGNAPPALAGLNTYRNFWVRDRVAPVIGHPVTNNDLFAQGRLALFQDTYSGNFHEQRVQGKFKWGMVIVPKGTAGKVGTQLTVNGMTISSLSKAPDAAWQFLKFIMEPETQLPAILSGASRPGLRKSVLRHPKLGTDMKGHTPWIELIEGASPWHQPANYRWAELNTAIGAALTPAFKGETTVEQALSQNMPQFDSILAKPKEGFV